jgi:hypothetical protein
MTELSGRVSVFEESSRDCGRSVVLSLWTLEPSRYVFWGRTLRFLYLLHSFLAQIMHSVWQCMFR